MDTISIEELMPARFGKPMLIVDVRSPKEYLAGHIPGAVNVPLLDDEERHVVGITYKEKGQNAAVEKGFELTGHKFHTHIKRIKELRSDNSVVLYCWRGGLRSNIMSWILNTAGIRASLVQGGYKAYRKHIHDLFAQERKIRIISGPTGSGKSALLEEMAARGEQVLHLEKIAHHKGSVFGGLGQYAQPTQEQFDNEVADILNQSNPQETLWVEDESRMIGRLRIPDALYDQMRAAPLSLLRCNIDVRKKRILQEYGGFEPEVLAGHTAQLNKRLGYDKAKLAVEAVLNGDKETWLDILLHYYDKAYEHGFSARALQDYATIDFDPDNLQAGIEMILKTKSH